MARSTQQHPDMYARNRGKRSYGPSPTKYGFRSQEWAGQSLGAILTAYREAYGKSVEEVADDLRIRRLHLRALEAGTYGDLPEMTYSAGFVRSYAKFLGLPSEEMVGRFRENYAEHSTLKSKEPRPVQSRGATVSYSPRWPSFAVLVIAALLLGSSYMVMSAYTASTSPTSIVQNDLEIFSSGEEVLEVLSFDEPQSTQPVGEPDIAIILETDEPATNSALLADPLEGLSIPLDGAEGTTQVYGTHLPLERPTNIDQVPQAPLAANISHRVIIRAQGRAYLKVFNHATGEAFLQSEYQRGDEYAAPDEHIVRLMSLDVAKIELIIDGVSYRVAPAIAALGDPLVLDPDLIVQTGQLIANEDL